MIGDGVESFRNKNGLYGILVVLISEADSMLLPFPPSFKPLSHFSCFSLYKAGDRTTGSHIKVIEYLKVSSR